MTSISSLSGSNAYSAYLQNLFAKTTSGGESASAAGKTSDNSAPTKTGGLAAAFDSMSLQSAALSSTTSTGSDGQGPGLASFSQETLQALFESLSQTTEASSTSAPFTDMVSAMDADRDGTVTKEEFLAAKPDDVTDEMAENLWNSFDTEGVDALSVDDLQMAMAENRPQPMGGGGGGEEDDSTYISALDTNEDGVVSLEELLAAKPNDVSDEMAENLFNALDTDGSGDLSSSEVASLENGPPPPAGEASVVAETVAETNDTAATSAETARASALQALLEAVKSYQTTAGYENTKTLMSSLENSMA